MDIIIDDDLDKELRDVFLYPDIITTYTDVFGDVQFQYIKQDVCYFEYDPLLHTLTWNIDTIHSIPPYNISPSIIYLKLIELEKWIFKEFSYDVKCYV